MQWFLVAVFALTFSLQLGARYLLPGSLLQMALIGVGGIAPGLVALVVARGKLFASSDAGQPAVAALGVVAIPLAAGLVGAAVDGHLVVQPPVLDATTIYLVLFAPFFEELAWRGLLQRRWDDALRARTGRSPRFTVPLVSLAVGLVWGLWHLPMWQGPPLGFLLFVLGCAGTSIWIGALFELSGRRVWVAMLAHAVINLGLFAAAASPGAQFARTAMYLGSAWLCVRALRGPARVT